ncbi:MAG: DUF501 domain-containing protein [Candidatus Bipolaricaulota bacterium]|nr:DUF501 domain-containing protein [Candidatus Bipolaricaulota bacterium]
MGPGRPDPGPLRPPTPEDLRVLAWQLGRPPRGVLAVRPCPYGFPQVVLNHPLLPAEGADPEPMPTIFWLSCPFLVAEVSKLESAGAVRRYERRIAEDAALAQAYARAHAAYRAERLALLSPAELAWVQEKGYTGLLTTGIAGIANFRRVKCLHAHLAHFLAGRENPVGEGVAAELPRLFCPPERVLCAQRP